MKKQTSSLRAKRAKKQRFPRGWDEERVKKVIEHYENQTEDEEVAEDEARFEEEGQTLMMVPSDLVPEIRELIARRHPA